MSFGETMEEFCRRKYREERAANMLHGPEIREKLITALDALREVFGSNDKSWVTKHPHDLHFLDDVELAGIEALCFTMHSQAKIEIEMRKRERRRLRLRLRLRRRKSKVTP